MKITIRKRIAIFSQAYKPTVGLIERGNIMKKQEIIVRTERLSKEFDSRLVLNHINLEVNEGEILGILGANGAGKTTLLKLMAGLLEPTEGRCIIDGNDPWSERDKVLKNIGILIEVPMFYEHLSAYENLSIHLEYMDVKTDIKSHLEAVGLSSTDTKAVSKYSLGMRQRLAIARCISHKPKILLLDEPINGLDPIAIKEMRELFIKLKEQGITIILSSHILSEITQTVERVGIIANGNIIEISNMSELKQQHGEKLENYFIEKMRGAIC